MEGDLRVIDKQRDALILNDFQNDFSRTGSLAIPDAEGILPRLLFMLKSFHQHNVFFFLHVHGLHRFEGMSDVRHCVVSNKIITQSGAVREQSRCGGVSWGAELEQSLWRYRMEQEQSGIHNVFHKMKCPLLGNQFSVMHICELDKALIRRGIQRVFFAGLNFEVCIRNEIDFLLHRKQLRPVILKDLVRSRHPNAGESIMKELSIHGAISAESLSFMK